jgi:hypothetical protein
VQRFENGELYKAKPDGFLAPHDNASAAVDADVGAAH